MHAMQTPEVQAEHDAQHCKLLYICLHDPGWIFARSWWVCNPVLDADGVRIVNVQPGSMKPMAGRQQPSQNDQQQRSANGCWGVVEGQNGDRVDSWNHENDRTEQEPGSCCTSNGYAEPARTKARVQYNRLPIRGY